MRATRPTWQHAPFRRLRSKQDPILELPNFALHPKSLPFPLPLNRLDIRQGNINYPRYNFIRTFFLIELKEKKKVISFSEIQSGERELMHERKREREKENAGFTTTKSFPTWWTVATASARTTPRDARYENCCLEEEHNRHNRPSKEHRVLGRVVPIPYS